MFLLRGLAYVIDLLAIYLPSYLLVGALPNYAPFANLFSLLLFFVYNVVALENFHQQTIGKFFAQLQVNSHSQITRKLDLNIMIRELAKSIYLLPGFIGVTGLLVSVILYGFTRTTLHDWLGQTTLTFIKKDEQHGE